MGSRESTLALVAAVAIAIAACSGDTPDTASDGSPSGQALPPASAQPSAPLVEGMCAQVEPDCDDMVTPSVSQRPDSGDEAGGAAGACPVTNPDCGDNPGAGDPGTDLDIAALTATPMTGLLDVAATPWEFVNFNQDQTIATVAWFGGNPACDGLDRVEVDLQATTVTFTVFTGRVPGDRVCTLELVLKAVEIDMGETLGPRSILDGSA